jgi:tetratricopeptide (TPR) repeat protein
MAEPELNRKRKKKKQSPVWKYWWLAPMFAGLAIVIWVATGPRWSRAGISSSSEQKPLSGYLGSFSSLEREYAHYQGKPLDNPEVKRDFELAAKRIAAQDYTGAIPFLEKVAETAAVPQIFNNLGVVYAEIGDKAKAFSAFSQALAQDIDYLPVRTNLERMPELLTLLSEPPMREMEPNNSIALANLLKPGTAMNGEIERGADDLDYFQITTPPAPNANLSIEITNHSKTLVPVLKIFDAQGRITDWGKAVREPGANLKQTITPPPSSILFLQISGYGKSAGEYTLLVNSEAPASVR